jgi:hypothetical protein
MREESEEKRKKSAHSGAQTSNYHVFTKKETINFGKSKI